MAPRTPVIQPKRGAKRGYVNPIEFILLRRLVQGRRRKGAEEGVKGGRKGLERDRERIKRTKKGGNQRRKTTKIQLHTQESAGEVERKGGRESIRN